MKVKINVSRKKRRSAEEEGCVVNVFTEIFGAEDENINGADETAGL